MTFRELIPAAKDHREWIVDLRRTIHRTPELMYEEVETSNLVRKTLDQLGIPYQADMAGGTGVLAQVGTGDRPCVALRADMDALPIHEEADVDFKSEIDGNMHACGHDCHTAMLLGAARLLKEREAELNGPVKLLFQPAEEGGAGGQKMVQEAALQNPDVARIFALHVWPWTPTGSIMSRAGTFLASTTAFEIEVRGKGGHAAIPNATIDPIITASKIVTEAQTIVSRENDPRTPLVLSFTAINGGEAFNVIPATVTLRGTIRTLATEHLAWAKNRLQEIVTGIATTNRCQAEVNFPNNDYPATVNDAGLWDLSRNMWTDVFGEETSIESPPIMGGEDFAFYAEKIPGCFIMLGIRNEEVGSTWAVHHPKFKVDEAALPVGSAYLAALALADI